MPVLVKISNESNSNLGRNHTEAQGEQSVSDPEASIGKIDVEIELRLS